MGQYQQDCLDVKGCTLELAHRNSQASVPFVVSNRGYGFLWNNPAIGEVTFGKNLTVWKAWATKRLDYWICAGDTPAQIHASYMRAVGTPPEMPEYGLGFWQCKLRYLTQEELLRVAREYKRRGLPIDVIVVDFFHWPLQGDWKFDPEYWPDPDAMIRELEKMGIALMVSIWPTVDQKSENYEPMWNRGLLVHTERGVKTTMEFLGSCTFFDATNPEARDYVWQTVNRNYYDKGVKMFWLDEAEPEYSVYDFDNYRYHLGSNLQVGNLFPVLYAKAFFDGMRAGGAEAVVNLLRCAWAGSAALRRAGVERGYRLQLPKPAQSALRRSEHGHGGHPLVDDRYRRLPRRQSERSGLPRAVCPLVRLGLLLPGDAPARRPRTA